MTAEWVGSPNYNTARTKIDRIVMHWMAGSLKGTDLTFQVPGGVSAHYGIENTSVHQYVKEGYTAFHSGDGTMNLRSIGIEHSAAPGRPASPSTIENSAKLVAELCKRHSIPCDRKHILKHNEITPTQCPGTIPVDQIIERANVILKGASDMPVKVDLNTARRMAYGVAGDEDAINGRRDAELKKNHVGRNLDDKYVKGWVDSTEAKNHRKKIAEMEAELVALRKLVGGKPTPLKQGVYEVK